MKLTTKVNSIDIKHEDATLAWITFDDDNIAIDADFTLEELEQLVQAIKEAYDKYKDN